MDRPKVIKDEVITRIPLGPAYQSGHLIDVSSGMRTFRPVIDQDKCKHCLRCFLVCPDGAIDKSEPNLEVDYDYCKGCGICNKACAFGAITMIKEVDA